MNTHNIKLTTEQVEILKQGKDVVLEPQLFSYGQAIVISQKRSVREDHPYGWMLIEPYSIELLEKGEKVQFFFTTPSEQLLVYLELDK
ncbi:TPA: hypothetical protein ACGWER_001774 [Streptococcus agalactiae]